jgi:hypothetical protein
MIHYHCHVLLNIDISRHIRLNFGEGLLQVCVGADTNVAGDAEIDQLRRRLEETEAAMERIVAQIETAVEPSRPSSSLLKTVPRQVRVPVTLPGVFYFKKGGADYRPPKNAPIRQILPDEYDFKNYHYKHPFLLCFAFYLVLFSM